MITRRMQTVSTNRPVSRYLTNVAAAKHFSDAALPHGGSMFVAELGR